MSPKTPKPKRGSADDHRGDDDDDNSDVEPVDIPGDPDVPDDAGDGGNGTGDGGSGGSGGTLSMLRSVNFRKLAFIGAAGVGLYVAWTYYRRMRHQQLVEMGRQDRERAEQRQQSGEGAAPGGQQEEEIVIPDDPNDPLAADEAAGNAIFDGWEGN